VGVPRHANPSGGSVREPGSENLEDGVTLADFVELFPRVTLEQARSVLEHIARSTAAALA
jgi:hypothetical protein